jgi:hypothetical protein
MPLAFGEEAFFADTYSDSCHTAKNGGRARLDGQESLLQDCFQYSQRPRKVSIFRGFPVRRGHFLNLALERPLQRSSDTVCDDTRSCHLSRREFAETRGTIVTTS